MEKTCCGGGRVLYWAHVTGPTERRASVRSGETAFEMLPLVTLSAPYANVMLLDLATHPRLIPANVLGDMLEEGVYLTDIARRSMPSLVEDHLARTDLGSGETVWEVLDTSAAFSRYWNDDPADATTQGLEARHRRIRAIAEGCGRLPLNAFPIPHRTVLAMMQRHLTTLDDLMDLDFQGVRLQSDLGLTDLAEAYRVIVGTLEARRLEGPSVYAGTD